MKFTFWNIVALIGDICVTVFIYCTAVKIAIWVCKDMKEWAQLPIGIGAGWLAYEISKRFRSNYE